MGDAVLGRSNVTRHPGFAAGAFLAIGTAAILAQFAMPGSVAQASAHAVINAAAAVAILAGIRWHRPANRAPWLALAATMTIFGITNSAWALQMAGYTDPWIVAVDRGGKPIAVMTISIATFFFLRDGGMARRRAALLDGVMSVFAGALLLVLWALAAQGADRSGGALVRLAPVALTGLTVGFVLVGHRIAQSRGARSTSMIALVTAAALCLAGATMVELYHGQPPRWVDTTWLLGTVLNGTAALHPSMATLASPKDLPGTLPPNRAFVLGAALLMNPIVVWVSLVSQTPTASLVTLSVTGVAALALLGMSATDSARKRPLEGEGGPSSGRASYHAF